MTKVLIKQVDKHYSYFYMEFLMSIISELAYFWYALQNSGYMLPILTLFFLIGVFEFINGFHDTANAIATVVYTNSLKPKIAVVLSSLFNLVGVLIGGVSVAYGIYKLIPADILYSSSQKHLILLLFSSLIWAIFWNFATWLKAIPASSSHTLIGAILGPCLGYSLIMQIPLSSGVNWSKAYDIGLSLIVSPVVGFLICASLIYLARHLITKNKDVIFQQIEEGKVPPWKFRIPLIVTSQLVSLVHGSNDGQKGVGKAILVLSCLGAFYSFNPNLKSKDWNEMSFYVNEIKNVLSSEDFSISTESKKSLIFVNKIQHSLTLNNLKNEEKIEMRQNFDLLLISLKKLEKEQLGTIEQRKILNISSKKIRGYIEYSPLFVILFVGISLGLGTLIGWKRVAHTIGSKLSKQALTYSAAISAQMTAAMSIGLASLTGLPVSTTHILSSSVVGGSWAVGHGINEKTIRTILITWALTLPVSMLGSFMIFMILVNIFK